MFKHLVNRFTLLAAALTLTGVAYASPVLTNGDFEAGDFSGWTLSSAGGANAVAADFPHAGQFSAFLGEVGTTAQLSQSLQTQAGHLYAVTFWLSNLGSSANEDAVNRFELAVGNTTLLSVTDKAAFDYQEFGFSFIADTDLTELVFNFRHDEIFWLLDDVAIIEAVDGVVLPEPSSLLLFGAVLAVVFLRRRA